MEVTFLRHAQSVFNRDLTSEKNCELTPEGIEQAKKVTGTFDVIICSLLQRAKQTLEHSQLSCKKLYFTDLCREVRVDICDFFENEDENEKETEEEVQNRITAFKQFLWERVTADMKVLVICHRDFIHEIGKKQLPCPNNCEFQRIILEN
jgi:broad specificity phosphatase PhoE